MHRPIIDTEPSGKNDEEIEIRLTLSDQDFAPPTPFLPKVLHHVAQVARRDGSKKGAFNNLAQQGLLLNIEDNLGSGLGTAISLGRQQTEFDQTGATTATEPSFLVCRLICRFTEKNKKQFGHLPHQNKADFLVLRGRKRPLRQPKTVTHSIEGTIVVLDDLKMSDKRFHSVCTSVFLSDSEAIWHELAPNQYT
jgi:hypothetical protein